MKEKILKEWNDFKKMKIMSKIEIIGAILATPIAFYLLYYIQPEVFIKSIITSVSITVFVFLPIIIFLVYKLKKEDKKKMETEYKVGDEVFFRLPTDKYGRIVSDNGDEVQITITLKKHLVSKKKRNKI